MADTVKRLNYFDHQFLRAPDFNDEQSYHLSMRRYHNQLLHTPGIVQGLVPTAQAGATVVTVSSGFAIDPLGREMVLPADKPLDLTNEASGTTVYFTIEYNEQQSDPSTDAGATGNTRWTELPNVTFSEQAPAGNSNALVLGQVTRTATGLSAIDLSARISAGVVVSGDLKVNSLSFRRDGVDPAAWPKLTSTGANQAQLSVSNLSIDANREIYFADMGKIRCFDDSHKIHFNRSANRLEVSEFGDIVFSTGGANPAERLRIDSSGNVGIGTQAARGRLQVSGGTATGTTIGLFGDMGVSLVANWPSVGLNCYYNAAWKSISPGFAGMMDVNQSDGYMEFYLGPAKLTAADANVGAVSRLRISPDGKLAIGAATPVGQLHVQKDATGALGPSLALVNGAGGTNAAVALDFYTYTPNGDPSASIRATDDGAGSNDILFLTKAPGAQTNTLQERLHIDSGGNVGIGTQPTKGRLQISGGQGVTVGLFGDLGISLVSNWPSVGWNSYFSGAWKSISPGFAGMMDVSQSDGFMDFYLANAKAAAGDAALTLTLGMRLSPDGYLHVGKTSPDANRHVFSLAENGGGQLQVASNNNDNNVYLEAFNAAGNGSASVFYLTGYDAVAVPVLSFVATTMQTSGAALKPGGGSWGATSDVRLKQNISTLGGALERLLALRGVQFEWKEPEKYANQTGAQIGLIAQEVEKVFPDWIGTDPEGFKTVNIRGFEALVIEALRELESDVTALKQQLNPKPDLGGIVGVSGPSVSAEVPAPKPEQPETATATPPQSTGKSTKTSARKPEGGSNKG